MHQSFLETNELLAFSGAYNGAKRQDLKAVLAFCCYLFICFQRSEIQGIQVLLRQCDEGKKCQEFVKSIRNKDRKLNWGLGRDNREGTM